MFFSRFKNYYSRDAQTDIFGEHWPFVQQLHQKSRADISKLVPFIMQYCYARIARKNVNFNHKVFDTLSLGIDLWQGRFLYNLVLAKRPKVIVEYGTSFGISTLYLAQALKVIGDGHVIGTERSASKMDVALTNLKYCGLNDKVDIYPGDILKTLKTFNQPIDMLFMDGFPELNFAVIKLIERHLNKSSIIVTDDATLFSHEMRDYLLYLERSPDYSTLSLSQSTGMKLSVKLSPALHYEPSSLLSDPPYAAEDCAQTKVT